MAHSVPSPGWLVKRLFDGSPALLAARDAAFSTYGKVAHLESNGSSCTVSTNARLTVDGVGQLGFLGDLKFDHVSGFKSLMEISNDWLKAQGCTHVQGPICRHTWYPFRVMTDGFDAAPLFTGEPVHPRELHSLLSDEGFGDVAWYVSTWSSNPAPQIDAARDNLRALTGAGYSFRSLAPARLGQDLALIHGLICDAFAPPWNYLFHPISFEEFQLVLGTDATTLDPTLIRLCMAPDGDIAGVLYCTKEADETLWVKTAAVSPLHRGKGLCSAMVSELTQRCLDAGFKRFAHALIRSGGPSDSVSAKGQTKVFRRYAVMEKTL